MKKTRGSAGREKRMSCDALNCGKRPYLHDDLKTVSLSDETVRTALELWAIVRASAWFAKTISKRLLENSMCDRENICHAMVT